MCLLNPSTDLTEETLKKINDRDTLIWLAVETLKKRIDGPLLADLTVETFRLNLEAFYHEEGEIIAQESLVEAFTNFLEAKEHISKNEETATPDKAFAAFEKRYLQQYLFAAYKTFGEQDTEIKTEAQLKKYIYATDESIVTREFKEYQKANPAQNGHELQGIFKNTDELPDAYYSRKYYHTLLTDLFKQETPPLDVDKPNNTAKIIAKVEKLHTCNLELFPFREQNFNALQFNKAPNLPAHYKASPPRFAEMEVSKFAVAVIMWRILHHGDSSDPLCFVFRVYPLWKNTITKFLHELHINNEDELLSLDEMENYFYALSSNQNGAITANNTFPVKKLKETIDEQVRGLNIKNGADPDSGEAAKTLAFDLFAGNKYVAQNIRDAVKSPDQFQKEVAKAFWFGTK